MTRHLLLPLLALAIIGTTRAGDGDFLPPEPLAMRALAAQPDVRAAVAAAQAAAAERDALAAGSYEWEAIMIPQRRTVDPQLRYREFEGQLSRRIRLPGKAALDRAIGEHALTAAQLGIDDATHQAARRLGQDWMTGLRAEALADDAQQQRMLMEQARQLLARRVQLGDAARRDLDLMDAELAQLRAAELSARADADAARKALATTYPQLPLPAKPPQLPEPTPLPHGAAYWRDLIIQRSHEIGIAHQNTLRQQSVAARARADRLPDPSIGLRVLDDRGGAERAVGLVVSVPLGTRYRRDVAEREAAHAAKVEAEEAMVRLEIVRDAQATADLAEARQAQWQALQAAALAQEAASARTRRAWELGEASLPEWLQAERMARASRAQERVARVDALHAALRVRIDSHELWHDSDTEETSASAQHTTPAVPQAHATPPANP